MDFKLSEEQEILRTQIRAFVAKEILPHWQRLRKKEFPRDIFKKMAEQGLAGAVIPEEYGGTGLDALSYVLITEEICRADGGVGLSIGASQSLVAKPIEWWGTEAQKREWLPKIATGEVIAAYAQTEPQAGSDVAGIRTKGAHDGDAIVVDGRKQFITNGSVADLILALVRTSDAEPRRGLTMVLVDAKRAKEEGSLVVLKDEDKAGLHCSPTSALAFENCRVPAENILGGEGMGFAVAMMTLTCSRAMIAAQSVGLAQAAFDCALEYVLEREQFGKKIAEFQKTQTKLAQMAVKIEAARLLTYRAAKLADEQGPMNFQEFMAEASMAKLYASTIAEEVASMAAKMHGGMGFMADSRVSAIHADSMVLQTYEGTSDIQELIIARKFLRPHGIRI